jgi:NAD(P)-dependent dehydrogenase (short-subunit alcohol dehydrogenase family)
MHLRLNPVSLIAGAAGANAAYAAELGRRSHGGLILADGDEAALAAIADALGTANAAPERVSTLAFSAEDTERWTLAADFIQSQYGRLDWAIIPTGPVPASSDLVEMGNDAPGHLQGALLALRTISPLMRKNTQGGGVVFTGALTPDLLKLVRAAAKQGAPERIRVNAIATGGGDMPMLSTAPWFQDLVAETASETAALDRIFAMGAPVARFAATGDVGRLAAVLLSDETPVSGATLVVDGGYTL